MLKTLRIASIAAASVAACAVLLVAVFGLRGNPDIAAYLSQKGVVEEYKLKVGEAPEKEDTVSPLVKQAELFALRIDPPPPPPPPPPKQSPTDQKPGGANQPAKVAPPAPPPPPPSKYNLVATAVYPEHPEKSLVLLRDVRGESKWYRQGEQVGNLTVQEIHNDRVLLFYNGQKNTELTLARSGGVRSLLKGEASASPAGGLLPVMTANIPAGMPAVEEPTVVPAMQEEITSAPSQSVKPGRTIPTRAQTRPTPSPSATHVSAVRTPPPVPTRQEQIASLDESISSIQEIMSKDVEGLGEDEQAEAQASWKELINLLQEEKKNLENASEETTPGIRSPSAE